MSYAKLIENEKPDGGRKISITRPVSDVADKLGECFVAMLSDVLQPDPECIFQADAGLASRNHDGTFHDRRSHYCLP